MVMINHGISTGALFLLIGMIYERRHTRLIEAYGGIARVVPLFAALLVIVSLSSIGLPATNGFVGEFLVLIGSFRTHPYFALFATTGVIFAAAYLLWAIQRILFNALDKPENEHITDLNARELTMMAVLVAAIILDRDLSRARSCGAWSRRRERFVSTVENGQASMQNRRTGDSLMYFRSLDPVAARGRASARSDPRHRGDAAAARRGLAQGDDRARAAYRRTLDRRLPDHHAARSSGSGARTRPRATGSSPSTDFRWATDCIVLGATIIAAIADDRLQRARTARLAGVVRAAAARGLGHDAARRGTRPDARLPRHRAHVDRESTCSRRLESSQRAEAPKAALKYFLLGAFSTASCSTASRSCTAPPARRTSPRSALP